MKAEVGRREFRGFRGICDYKRIAGGRSREDIQELG